METQPTLNKIVNLLHDSRLGYAAAAKRADDPRLKELLAKLGEGRSPMIEAVNVEIIRSGAKPRGGGTLLGWMHRLWMGVRDLVSYTDDVNMLSECIRGESYLIGRYDDALTNAHVNPFVAPLLHAQRAMLLSNVEEVNELDRAFSKVRA